MAQLSDGKLTYYKWSCWTVQLWSSSVVKGRAEEQNVQEQPLRSGIQQVHIIHEYLTKEHDLIHQTPMSALQDSIHTFTYLIIQTDNYMSRVTIIWAAEIFLVESVGVWAVTVSVRACLRYSPVVRLMLRLTQRQTLLSTSLCTDCTQCVCQ